MSGSEGRAYAVVGVPSTEAYKRLNKVMKALRSNLGGPKFDPHLTITGPINLTREDAIKKFREACKGLKAYPAHSQAISAGDSYWQSIFVLLHSTAQLVEVSDHFNAHFGYDPPTQYKPHISLLYGHLTDEEKHEAVEEAKKLDDTIDNMCFTIDCLQLYSLTIGDETLKSWVKVAEYHLTT
ncbi:cyclic phosphodiesterase-like [Amaranthus tricolor]|uniref:cyclic phosphodiesterase-like n=1 Tax=Amaranthus tricolor TaxID=29722 RepID=UPI00258811A3|nr:cyclic phosphodiesterase-like [Amaranthus tricolor]